MASALVQLMSLLASNPVPASTPTTPPAQTEATPNAPPLATQTAGAISAQTGLGGGLGTRIPPPQTSLSEDAFLTTSEPSTTAVAATDVLSEAKTSSVSSSTQDTDGSKRRNAAPQLPNFIGVASASFATSAPPSPALLTALVTSQLTPAAGVPPASLSSVVAFSSQRQPLASVPFLSTAALALESPAPVLTSTRPSVLAMSSVASSVAAAPAISSVISSSLQLSNAGVSPPLATPTASSPIASTLPAQTTLSTAIADSISISATAIEPAVPWISTSVTVSTTSQSKTFARAATTTSRHTLTTSCRSQPSQSHSIYPHSSKVWLTRPSQTLRMKSRVPSSRKLNELSLSFRS